MQPPASLQALDDPIYEAFYGLNEPPFAITADPRFFYLSESHQRAFSELLNGLRRRESLVLLVGETGAGKTTLCRAATDALGDRTFSAMVLNPYMSGAEVLRIVLRDFGLVSHDDLRRGALAAADTTQLLDTLEGFLRSLPALGSQAVIVVDEAQSLAPQTLDQVRMLTALEDHGHRLVQVVLCGQPSLLKTLKDPSLYALNERITRRVEIRPLPSAEVEAYIQHRLGVAGGTGAVSFEPAATAVITDLARGIPRRINVLCDRALQEGRIEGVGVITPDLVKRAARAVAGAFDVRPTTPKPQPKPAAVRVSGPPPPPEPAPEPPPESRADPEPVRQAEAEPEPTPAVALPLTALDPPRPGPARAAPLTRSVFAPAGTFEPLIEDVDPPLDDDGDVPLEALDRPQADTILPLEDLPSRKAELETPTVPPARGTGTAGDGGSEAEEIETEPADEESTESARASGVPTFGFGETSAKEAAARPLRRAMLVCAAVVVLAGGGYAAWAGTAPEPDAVIPVPPDAPVLGVQHPTGPLAVPEPADIESLATPVRRPLAAAAVPPATSPGTTAPESPAQLPGADEINWMPLTVPPTPGQRPSGPPPE